MSKTTGLRVLRHHRNYLASLQLACMPQLLFQSLCLQPLPIQGHKQVPEVTCCSGTYRRTYTPLASKALACQHLHVHLCKCLGFKILVKTSSHESHWRKSINKAAGRSLAQDVNGWSESNMYDVNAF
jgi:hypothetical protein